MEAAELFPAWQGLRGTWQAGRGGSWNYSAVPPILDRYTAPCPSTRRMCTDKRVGGPQTSSANGKSANLRTVIFLDFRFADLPQMWQFADLRFADHICFVICGFAICGPNLALILIGINSTREVLLRTRVYCRLQLTAGLKLHHTIMYPSTAKHSLLKIQSGPILLASFFSGSKANSRYWTLSLPTQTWGTV